METHTSTRWATKAPLSSSIPFIKQVFVVFSIGNIVDFVVLIVLSEVLPILKRMEMTFKTDSNESSLLSTKPPLLPLSEKQDADCSVISRPAGKADEQAKMSDRTF